MRRLHLSAMRRPDRIELNDASPEISAGDDPGLCRDLLRTLAALSKDQRAVLLLVGLEQFAYKEAADVLGMLIDTVMSRLSRTCKRMRAALDGALTVSATFAISNDDGSAAPRRVK